MREPLISIVVPAYNAESTIKRCIDSLVSVNYSNYEIFVVDDGSTDNTKMILSEYKNRINIIESQHHGTSYCRNIAVKEAKGEFVAFTDADCIVDKNWLNELIKGFTSDKIAGTGGTQLSPQDETKFGKIVQQFFELTGFLGGYIKKKGGSGITKVDHNPSCNVMYKRSIFLEVGGFDENLWPSEDVDLDYRLKRKGYGFRYNSKAIVYHYRPQSLKSLSRMMFHYGITQGILTKRYGLFRPILLFPFSLIIFLMLLFLQYNFLWVIVFYYVFVLMRIHYFFLTNLVFFISILSVFSWNIGFFRGLFKVTIRSQKVSL